ncbi:MAG: hypothetical protein FJZ01_21135 [Candidatus Sericytochromatia bacterium]|nr:hypothetical protein [Candidatus Tanganyikabacteria bacterium]
MDAQQKAESLQVRSLRRGELLGALGESLASRIVVVLDACFSGRGSDGDAIAPGPQPLPAVQALDRPDPRMVVLTAARGDQFAGALPGAARPAFSYLVLGGLRGWADGGGRITAGALWRYSTDALRATLRGREQTPDLIGDEATVVARSSAERAPDLAALARATAGGFRLTELPAVPTAQAPRALDVNGAGGVDFRSVDLGALELYEAASKLDRDTAASPGLEPGMASALARHVAAGPQMVPSQIGRLKTSWKRVTILFCVTFAYGPGRPMKAVSRGQREKPGRTSDGGWPSTIFPQSQRTRYC